MSTICSKFHKGKFSQGTIPKDTPKTVFDMEKEGLTQEEKPINPNKLGTSIKIEIQEKQPYPRFESEKQRQFGNPTEKGHDYAAPRQDWSCNSQSTLKLSVNETKPDYVTEMRKNFDPYQEPATHTHYFPEMEEKLKPKNYDYTEILKEQKEKLATIKKDSKKGGDNFFVSSDGVEEWRKTIAEKQTTSALSFKGEMPTDASHLDDVASNRLEMRKVHFDITMDKNAKDFTTSYTQEFEEKTLPYLRNNENKQLNQKSSVFLGDDKNKDLMKTNYELSHEKNIAQMQEGKTLAEMRKMWSNHDEEFEERKAFLQKTSIILQ